MTEILMGLALGVAYVVAPGPINVEAVRRGLCDGVRGALAVMIGAALGDIPYALIVLIGGSAIVPALGSQRLLGVIGGALLLYLGVSTIRDAWRSAPVRQQQLHRTMVTGLLLSITSPAAIAFWLAVATLTATATTSQMVTLIACLGFAIAVSSVLLALVVGAVRCRITPRLLGYAAWGCGVTLLGCGFSVGYTALLP